MADRHVDFLLVGGGLASANCARWLREEGAEGSILLVGREPEPPYNRPPCSKGYLQGIESREDTYVRPQEWWEEASVELLTRTSVLKLDTEDRVAVLSSQEQVSFDKALIATGANVRLLRVEGSQLDGIHYLRALGNADKIRADAENAERVVVIGGSYIGTEVAASLTKLGNKVSIVMQESVTHERGFGAQAGRFFQSVLEQQVGPIEVASQFPNRGRAVLPRKRLLARRVEDLAVHADEQAGRDPGVALVDRELLLDRLGQHAHEAGHHLELLGA